MRRAVSLRAVALTCCLAGSFAAADVAIGVQQATSRVALCAPDRYQDPVPVLFARTKIRKGTLGSSILRNRTYASFKIRCGERSVGAVSDPSFLQGRVVVFPIQPGQQLTRGDFSGGPAWPGVVQVAITTPVAPGQYASLTVEVTPRDRCTIAVYHASLPTPKGLDPQTGASITWRWRLDRRTQWERSPILVRCGRAGTLATQVSTSH